MLQTDFDHLAAPRPAITSAASLDAAIRGLAPLAGTPHDLWRLLTESFAVDLDELAARIPVDRPEPVWLSRRAA